ncbi:hypothetical protein quinque_014010 [Culex quinquefasciatus]
MTTLFSLFQTVPSKISLKVRLIDYGNKLVKIVDSPSARSLARSQRAYPDSDEEPCGIVNHELAEIIQPPVTPILLDVQSDVADRVHLQPAGLPYEDQIRDLDPTAVENPGLIIEQLQEVS